VTTAASASAAKYGAGPGTAQVPGIVQVPCIAQVPGPGTMQSERERMRTGMHMLHISGKVSWAIGAAFPCVRA
jgi:hypothetical protein